MKGLTAAGAILLMAGRLLAQQQQEDPVERDVQRLKDRLNLTDEQVTKAREIVKKEHEDLKSILNDEQKKTYDQGGGRGGFNRGGQGGTPGGTTGTRSAWYPSTDELKKDLTLTDDQVTKINAVRDGVREEMRRFFQGQGRRGGGGQDFQAAMDKMRDEATGKIRDVLTDEQKPKFDEIIKTYRADQSSRAPFGRGGTGGGTVDERVKSVMDALKVEKPEEAEAVKGVVKKVLELMDKLGGFQRDARTKIDEASRNRELSDKEIGQRIEEIQKGQSEIEKDLKTARKELADIVSNRQELELLRRGILR